ncbi:hypothetical protein BAAM0483_09065 [Bifidobacterium animalis subsp. animalis MCC 0483]|uniref:Uncharacterized protein n=1 Tax=Bifidobacterium animalis subsp. animalis MCC 0483 TaxID=1365955 RepID=A0AB34T735_9BIFI|nr:hypothetical protein BAAM0483_09065 [Bifidobacterium animalis subsp. animalis MCC 0483]
MPNSNHFLRIRLFMDFMFVEQESAQQGRTSWHRDSSETFLQ